MEKWLTPALLTRFMFNPYENIVIGNFLYGLGLAMGRHPRGVDGCVNLLQQTPLDPVLGDVMLHFPAVWRLIEFKRTGAKLDKEYAKLELFLGATKNNDRMRAASRLVHWYASSGEDDQAALVRPYLDMRCSDGVGISIERFAVEVVRQACEGESTSLADLDLYMTLISMFGQLKGVNSSGFLVGVSSSGGVTYVPVPDIADLRGTASMLRERMALKAREIDSPHVAFSEAVRRRMLEHHIEPQTPSRGHGRS